jgi:chloride channel 3/4/5
MTRERGRYMRPQSGDEYEEELEQIRFVSLRSICGGSYQLLGDTRISPLSVCPRSRCTSWFRWFHSCNFSILDWIQDSIIERNRRIRDTDKSRTAYRGPNGEITPAWVWAQCWKLVIAGESWFVITLVGSSCFCCRNGSWLTVLGLG